MTQDSGLRTQDSGLRTNYALIKYYSYNIGDEIQSVAAQRFLPRVDYYVYREHLNAFAPDVPGSVKMIMNAFYMFNVHNFPPSEKITPLLISMYFTPEMQNVIISNKRAKNYLIENGPVGCRDKYTMNFCEANDIPAYFSGCLTMTLQENPALKVRPRDEYILCADVPYEVLKHVQSTANKPVYALTKSISSFFDSTDRFELAKIFLFLYHNASAVVTTNLHTALPSLAFNTPVCLIEKGIDTQYPGRFDGIYEFLHHCPAEEFVEGRFYDVNNPPENPDTFRECRNSLIRTCRDFTGYDSERPTLPDNYRPDIFALMRMMSVNAERNRRVICKMSAKEIAGMFIRKSLHKLLPRVFKNIVNPDY